MASKVETDRQISALNRKIMMLDVRLKKLEGVSTVNKKKEEEVEDDRSERKSGPGSKTTTGSTVVVESGSGEGSKQLDETDGSFVVTENNTGSATSEF